MPDQPQVGQVVHHVERREVGDVDEVDAAQVQLGDAVAVRRCRSSRSMVDPPSISAASDVWFSTALLKRDTGEVHVPCHVKSSQARKIGLGQIQFCQGWIVPQDQATPDLVSPLKAPASMLVAGCSLRLEARQIRQPAEVARFDAR